MRNSGVQIKPSIRNGQDKSQDLFERAPAASFGAASELSGPIHSAFKFATPLVQSSLPRETERPPEWHLDWRADTNSFLIRYAHISIKSIIGLRIGNNLYGSSGFEDPMTGVQYQEMSKTASQRTCQLRWDMTFRLMSMLRESGFRIASPWNLRNRHINKLVSLLEDNFKKGKFAAGSIAQLMSVLRWWSSIAGKNVAFENAKAGVGKRLFERRLIADSDKS